MFPKIPFLKATVILFISLLSFHAFAEEDELLEEVESLTKKFEKPVLLEISNRLILMANEEDLDGDYFHSIKHYRQAYLIRKYAGIPEEDLSNASLLYLLSISEMHYHAFCDAKIHAEEAKKIFQIYNNQDLVQMIDSELKNITNECILASLETSH